MTPARPAPDVPISHHLPEGKQTGPRRIPPRAARHCGQAKADAASPRLSPRRAAPLLRAPSRWLRVPGGGGSAGRRPRRRRAGALGRSLARSGSGPRGGCAPSAAPRVPIRRLPSRGAGVRGGAGAPGRCLGAQGSYFVSPPSPRPRSPTRGPSGPVRDESAAAAGEGGRARARAGWPATGARRPDLLGSQLRRRGAEEPVLPRPTRNGCMYPIKVEEGR
nr:uncharacterized protein LOC111774926 [Equus caballus]